MLRFKMQKIFIEMLEDVEDCGSYGTDHPYSTTEG